MIKDVVVTKKVRISLANTLRILEMSPAVSEQERLFIIFEFDLDLKKEDEIEDLHDQVVKVCSDLVSLYDLCGATTRSEQMDNLLFKVLTILAEYITIPEV